jgi:hypothetical protein
MDVRLPDGRVVTNVPEGTTQAELMRRLKLAETPTQEPVRDPLTSQVNQQALESISAAIPEPVKEAASAAGETISGAWNALPEGVKEPLKTTGNFLLDALDYLQRPFQAVAVSLKETRRLEKERPLSERNPFEIPQAFTKEGAEKVQAAAARGFTGKEKASTQELLSDEFRKENPVKSAILGFAGDVVLDPLNIGNPFNVVKGLIKSGPETTSIPSRLTDNELFRAFNVTTGDTDKARNLYNEYRYLRDKATNEGVRNAKILNKEIKILSKKTGIPENELKAKIVHDIETGSLSDNAIGEIEQKIINRNQEILANQRAAGVEIGDLGETYMPHILTKEADEIVNNPNKNFFGVRPSAKTPSALNRELEGTVAEINAKNLYGSTKFFEDDPAILAGVAEFRAANAIAGRKFLDDAKQLGVPKDTAPAGFKTVPEIPDVAFPPEVARLLNRSYRALTNTEEVMWFLKKYDGAQNWWKMWTLGARPAYHTKNIIGNLWNAYLGGVSNPVRYGEAGLFQTKLAKASSSLSSPPPGTTRVYRGMQEKFKQVADDATEAGRWFTTDINLAKFYGKNLYYVDVPNNIIDDLNLERAELSRLGRTEAADTFLLPKDIANKVKPYTSSLQLEGKIAGIDAQELYEAMATRGVFGEGQYRGDIARTIRKEIEGGSRNPLTLRTDNPVLQAGFKFGQTMEDNARIALFIDRVKKGQSYDAAGKAVKKYLFDYGDLSPVEQSVFKRVMPFYTWSRNNIPLQFEALALHPDKMNKINLAKENIQSAYGVDVPDPSEVPSYVVDGMPIYLGSNTDPATVSVFQLQNTLPLADLAPFFRFLNTTTEPSTIERNRLDPAISNVLSGVSPLIKAPIEFLANYDFFRRRAIKEYEGQKADLLGIEMPVHIAKLLSNVVMLAEIDRLNPNGIFGTRTKDVKTGEITSTPSIFGTQRESRLDLEEDQRINQALFGLRVLDINLEDVDLQKARKIRSDINAAKALVRRALSQEKTREAETAMKSLEWYVNELDRLEAERKERQGGSTSNR